VRLLIASEVERGRDLEVEIVVDIACRDDVRVRVLFATSRDGPVDVVTYATIFLDFVIHLAQIEDVLLQVRLGTIGSLTLGGHEGICLECTASLGLGESGSHSGNKQRCVENFHLFKYRAY